MGHAGMIVMHLNTFWVHAWGHHELQLLLLVGPKNKALNTHKEGWTQMPVQNQAE